MYFDGAVNLEGAGAGVLLISPRGDQLKYVLQIHYKASNNGAEYEALIHALHIPISMDIKRLLCYDDSSVIVKQVNKEWDIRKEMMDANCAEVHELKAQFYGLEVHFVPGEQNVGTDVVSKLGSKRALVPAAMFVQDLHKPSIKLLDNDNSSTDTTVMPPRSQQVLVVEGDWHAPIIDFIVKKKSYPDQKGHEKLARQAANYVMIDNELYRRSASQDILMRCIPHDQGIELLREIHKGACGNHAAAGSFRQRFLIWHSHG